MGTGGKWKAAVHTTTSSMHLQKGSEIHRASLELANSRPGSQGQKFNYLLLKCMQKNQPRHKLELIYVGSHVQQYLVLRESLHMVPGDSATLQRFPDSS